MDDLELKRKSLPNEPGIYFFKDKKENVIYIGKASNLRKRVSQYFLKTSYNDPYYEEKLRELVKNITSIEYIVTSNEKEAYLLENIQIKKHQPRFNVIMRDSKSYPWVAIFYNEEFPRIRILRNPEKHSPEICFIGPYTDKKEITRILRDLRKLFPYCSCKKTVTHKARSCLYHQLKLCPGPCISAINKNDYLSNIQKIELFLKGETDELKGQLINKMKKAAEEQNYEVAAFWRDKLEAIEHSTLTQDVLSERREDKDIIGFYKDDRQLFASLTLIHIREGRMVHKNSFTFDLREKIIEKDEILPSILGQFYQDTHKNLPNSIILPYTFKAKSILENLLKDYNESVEIRIANKLEEGLLKIAEKNARVLVEQLIQMEEIKHMVDEYAANALEEAMDLLHLKSIPKVIEGFDISNIEGKDATGSMVFFFEGKPDKKNYRHYKIRSKDVPDDVGMMKEIIKRRYSYLKEHHLDLPNLILIDGGKGQLNGALEVLDELNIKEVPIIGLAKKQEEIYLPNQKNPIKLSENSPLLKLFQNVRNEAHRFAIRLHKKQREKLFKYSSLEKIPGIGPTIRNRLLKHFGSIEMIKGADDQELVQVVGEKLTAKLRKYL
jgi:excinuclease ABC subunit C